MIICGLDECGRGPLAGPLVAAGVILTRPVPGLKDSKALTPKKRKMIFEQLVRSGAIVRIETISVRQINNRGIGWANKEVFKKLIKTLDADRFVVDGNLKIKVRDRSRLIVSMVKADSKVAEVMAASIAAKVTRDKLMGKLHMEFPNYGWGSNFGYGTRHHLLALLEGGPSKYHRSVFVNTALRRLALKNRADEVIL